MRLQALALIDADVDVRAAAEDAEVADGRLALVPFDERRSPCRERGGGEEVVQVHVRVYCLAPERRRQTGACEHRSDSVSDSAIAAFRDTVLLRGVARRLLGVDARRAIPFVRLAAIEHALLVVVDALELESSVKLGLSFEHLHPLQRLVLLAKKVDVGEALRVVRD